MEFSLKNTKRIVALGDSVTSGMSATAPEKSWPSRVTAMLEELTGNKIELINQGLCGNVLSVDTPAYEHSSKPVGLERVQQDVIDQKPDILLIAYGLNDARGGTEMRVFRRDFQKLIDEVREQIHPLIVCLNSFCMHEIMYKNCEFWEESDYDISEEYNLVIRQLAEKNSLVLADVYSAQYGCDWTVCEDHCHPNDLGHQLIANRVYEAIVRAADPRV